MNMGASVLWKGMRKHANRLALTKEAKEAKDQVATGKISTVVVGLPTDKERHAEIKP